MLKQHLCGYRYVNSGNMRNMQPHEAAVSQTDITSILGICTNVVRKKSALPRTYTASITE
jgi:hypothetical protein